MKAAVPHTGAWRSPFVTRLFMPNPEAMRTAIARHVSAIALRPRSTTSYRASALASPAADVYGTGGSSWGSCAKSGSSAGFRRVRAGCLRVSSTALDLGQLPLDSCCFGRIPHPSTFRSDHSRPRRWLWDEGVTVRHA
jgi:hypothetical protein